MIRKLAIFEVLTAFSASLAIAIPTFMDKVMRPKYEERFEEFRKARRETFFDEFEDASRKLRQTTEEIAPETVEAMENLFGEWGQLRSDENRLKKLLFMRKFFYVGWFLVSGLCLSSIPSSENQIGQIDLTLGQATIFAFIVMFLASLWYGYNLFDLDEQLSKFKGETTGAVFGKTENVRISLGAYFQLEQNVETVLKKFKIPFAKNALLKTNGVRTEVDFAIPSGQNPKFAIEIKSRPRMSFLYEFALRFKEIKDAIPLKTILISDFQGASAEAKKVAQAYWDYVVDFEDLDRLKEIIRL